MRASTCRTCQPERFSAFELTDEKEAERIERLAVIPHGFAMLRMDAKSALGTLSIASPPKIQL